MSGATKTRGVLAHPFGNQFVRHLGQALAEGGRLAEFCTCLDWQLGKLDRLLPRGLAAELGRRSFGGFVDTRTATRPAREALRLLAGRAGWTALTRHEIGLLSTDSVGRDFDAWVARRVARATEGTWVYAYEDFAEATFRAAGTRGWRRIYDLPIAYWETGHRLLAEEAVRWPKWEFTLESTRNSVAKLERKTRELELADVVVCPSDFVVESLPAAVRSGKRIILAPFGSPESATAEPRRAGAKLRVLFAGAMTQRKGLADLFEAVRRLRRSDVELVVMGTPMVPLEFYRREGPEFVYEPPRPHAEVLALMQRCDVLCLPSIVEGRALVVQEAMSAGLPAIVTLNTGAADVVADGRNGFVVPIRAPEIIAEKLAWLADHRSALPVWAAEARAAAARRTWRGYVAKIVAGLGGGE